MACRPVAQPRPRGRRQEGSSLRHMPIRARCIRARAHRKAAAAGAVCRRSHSRRASAAAAAAQRDGRRTSTPGGSRTGPLQVEQVAGSRRASRATCFGAAVARGRGLNRPELPAAGRKAGASAPRRWRRTCCHLRRQRACTWPRLPAQQHVPVSRGAAEEPSQQMRQTGSHTGAAARGGEGGCWLVVRSAPIAGIEHKYRAHAAACTLGHLPSGAAGALPPPWPCASGLRSGLCRRWPEPSSTIPATPLLQSSR